MYFTTSVTAFKFEWNSISVILQYLSIVDKLHQRMFFSCMNDLPRCAKL